MTSIYFVSDSLQPTEFSSGRTLADRVRNAILQDLAMGTLMPGEPLDEKRLCERFGVSRTPVREAFLQLVAQGFAVSEARSSVTIPKLSLQHLRNLLELIGELEAIAARLAAKRATGPERTRIEAALERCQTVLGSESAEDYELANSAFHDSVYAASHNEMLAEQLHQLRMRVAGYTRNRFDSPGRAQRSYQEHAVVAQAIAAGDEVGAWRAMAEHVAIGGKDFAEFVSGISPELLGS